MAAAGLPEWRIRVFGRWGSLAVRRYIRESDAVSAARGIAEDVTRATVRDAVARRVADKASATPALDVKRVRRLVLEVLAEQARFAAAPPLAFGCEDVERAAATAVQAPPAPSELVGRHVRSRRGRILHVVRDGDTSWCGWKWSLPFAGGDLCAPGTLGPLCGLCRRAAPKTPVV